MLRFVCKVVMSWTKMDDLGYIFCSFIGVVIDQVTVDHVEF